jgi:hypothetical protein
MYSSLKFLIVTVLWVCAMLVWINVGRNPVDRVLHRTGARDRVSDYCSRANGCSAVEFSRPITSLFPLEPIRCQVRVQDTNDSVKAVRKILDESITGDERRYFVVVQINRGGA